MEDWSFDFLNEIESQHWWFTARREIVLDVLKRFLPARQPLKIVDVGCGSGFFLKELTQFGNAEGIDASSAALRYAGEQLQRVRWGALPDHLPCADEDYDVVTLLDVLEHIQDDAAALVRLRQTLKANGLMVCTVPAFPALWSMQDELGHHYRRYRSYELAQKMESAGFVVRKISYYNCLLFPLVLGGKLLQANRKRSLSLLQTPPRPMNALLRHLFSLEKFWLRRHIFHFGVSILAVGEKS